MLAPAQYWRVRHLSREMSARANHIHINFNAGWKRLAMIEKRSGFRVLNPRIKRVVLNERDFLGPDPHTFERCL
jgi:hypothetical protein